MNDETKQSAIFATKQITFLAAWIAVLFGGYYLTKLLFGWSGVFGFYGALIVGMIWWFFYISVRRDAWQCHGCTIWQSHDYSRCVHCGASKRR